MISPSSPRQQPISPPPKKHQPKTGRRGHGRDRRRVRVDPAVGHGPGRQGGQGRQGHGPLVRAAQVERERVRFCAFLGVFCSGAGGRTGRERERVGEEGGALAFLLLAFSLPLFSDPRRRWPVHAFCPRFMLLVFLHVRMRLLSFERETNWRFAKRASGRASAPSGLSPPPRTRPKFLESLDIETGARFHHHNAHHTRAHPRITTTGERARERERRIEIDQATSKWRTSSGRRARACSSARRS